MRGNRPSHTAFKVAWGLVLAAEDPALAEFVLPETGRRTRALLKAAGVFRPWHDWTTASPRARACLRALERATLPGVSLHLALRKRYFRDEVRSAIEAGARQVLVLGAGYDLLAPDGAREHPEVRFHELDHPATQALKRAALETLGWTRDNLSLTAVDLARTPLVEALAAVETWDPRAPTFVAAEGLLMYLSEGSVRSLLDALHASTGDGSRFVFTFTRPDERGRVYLGSQSTLGRLGLRLVGEPMLWCTQREDLARLVAQHGFELVRGAERVNLRRRYLQPLGRDSEVLTNIEFMAVAERRST